MPLDAQRARQYLKDFNFKSLFVEELGWERHAATHPVTVDGKSYRLDTVAHKRGLAVFVCEPGPSGRIPDYPTRRKIDRQVAKIAHEHVIVFVDSDKATQIWQWVKKEPGKPVACREHTFYKTQPGDALIQKLQALNVSIDEEASLTLPGVAGRVRAAFDVERVTKRFYDRFKSEHEAFLKFLKGIPDEDMQRWYVSVMLNRLMFIYFIQKKGFLGNNNQNYLRDKLAESKRRGKDVFYREFLGPLFFEGFAKKEAERSAATNTLLGKVPYLNGGLFLRHQIEERYGNAIRIGDAAFDKLFAFFEEYHWHLDERPLKRDDEINPDVLGYIFEKYINQKQMGAYYSKEDITGYISQNAVIPYLFDHAHKACKIAFEGDHSVWRLLRLDPDRYIHEPIRRGLHLALPPEIAAGLNDVSKRAEWNKSASEEFALPAEIWREVVTRRKRYEQVRSKLASGQVCSVNDLITYNLDIRQFAQDVIETSEGPELVRAFYKAIKTASVLDPACGSGAFLFAALNILEALYEACLDRMQIFFDELQQSKEKHRPEKFSDFRKELELVATHPNRKYFIYKTIIVNNLFGVDIMEEAIEICKLRLFLKLVAQIDKTDQIEPLPDIDFNIRAGNTLVGYASHEEVKLVSTGTGRLDFERGKERIREKAEEIDRLFDRFREQQTALGGTITPADKNELLRRLRLLEDELNRCLAREYGIDPQDVRAYERWLGSHKPFHWFVDFYGIMRKGGFDIIIGNPPYVEYSKIADTYSVKSYRTLPCGNLYAFMLERSYRLLHAGSRLAFIVPLSLVCTGRMVELRRLVGAQHSWVSCYDMRPNSLFEGVSQRLSIVISDFGTQPCWYTGGYRRWASEERPTLLQLTSYLPQVNTNQNSDRIPKFSSEFEPSILQKIAGPRLELFVDEQAAPIFVHRIVRYFVKALDFVPLFVDSRGKKGKSEDYKEFRFQTAEAQTILAVLNSSLFYWFWRAHSDGFHCGYADAFAMPYRTLTSAELRSKLCSVTERLMDHLRQHSMTRAISTKAGTIKYQEFYPKHSKTLLDTIDRILGEHYAFADTELDFIMNYDIKYRLGDELEEADD